MKFIVHADGASDPKKRWLCIAESNSDGVFSALRSEPVGDPTILIRRLCFLFGVVLRTQQFSFW